ncbi:MAG: dihydrofolate reductase family protein [bacterium]|nr:dihydrofolate reductase family protein [bacterium]
MKTILVMVMSADGKTTAGKNGRVHDWSSSEDQRYFSALIKKSELVIMGRKTFLAARRNMKLSPTIHRIVLTRKPLRYKKFEVSKQLEFTDESPQALVKRLEKYYQTALLVGGSEINSAFLKASLIDELWLTIEPLILENGKTLFSKDTPNKRMRLLHSKRLNKSGTLLLKYTVER